MNKSANIIEEVGDIEGFKEIKIDDQEYIKKLINNERQGTLN